MRDLADAIAPGIAAAGGVHDGLGSRIPGIAALALLACALIAGTASLFSARWRRMALQVAGLIAAGTLGVYLVGRGIAEFWVVSPSDPASYRQSWGGPSLAGVLAVHSGPGLAVIVAAGWRYSRRRARTPRERAGGSGQHPQAPSRQPSSPSPPQ